MTNKPHCAWIDDAHDASKGSNCARRAVGAVFVRENRLIISGRNGVNGSFKDCIEAGCPRCRSGGKLGVGYDLCLCVHAEQNAIAEAARTGIAIEGCSAYVTLRPCLTCLALMLASGIVEVFYDEDWLYEDEVEEAYRGVANQFAKFTRIPRIA